MEYHKLINKALLRKYGKDSLGRPMYRLVQNENLTEKRFGKYNIFYGHIFIREEKGALETLKYPYIPKGHWILEKLFYTTNDELTEKATYEPLWHFNVNGEYQVPNLRACELLIKFAQDGPKSLPSREDELKKEVEEFYEILGGNASAADYLSAGEGIYVPSSFNKGE